MMRRLAAKELDYVDIELIFGKYLHDPSFLQCRMQYGHLLFLKSYLLTNLKAN